MTPPKPIPQMTTEDWVKYNDRVEAYIQKLIGLVMVGPLIGAMIILLADKMF